MREFKLEEKEVDFLKKMYPDNPIVKKILSCKKGDIFVVSVDDKIDFMEFIEDESVYWMDENQEPSKETIILEKIRDSIYEQTN